jgi:hypothetical protein
MAMLRSKAKPMANGLLLIAAGLVAIAVLPWDWLVAAADRLPSATIVLVLAALACAGLAVSLLHAAEASAVSQRPTRPIPWWWMLVAALAVLAAIWITTVWLMGETIHVAPASDRAKARIEAVRTGLTAGAGIGAAVALLLSFRRQHHEEVSSANIDFDATEKRITELYTKAVEQVGSDNMVIRLGGLYALERLAQNHPQQRQTIVNLICAYLRMPYVPPGGYSAVAASGDAAEAEPSDVPPTDLASLTPDHAEEERRGQELHVRSAAQNVLAGLLRLPSGTDDPKRPTLDLDLTAAVLIGFDMSKCRVGRANFTGARFGYAYWGDPAGLRETNFTESVFVGEALFGGARVSARADYGRAMFESDAHFRAAIFESDACFEEAMFNSHVEFDRVNFWGTVRFNQAKFKHGVRDIGFADSFVQELRADHQWPSGWALQPHPDGEGAALVFDEAAVVQATNSDASAHATPDPAPANPQARTPSGPSVIDQP